MATATKNGVLHTIERVKRAWADMDYAQRRLMEIRTGVPVGAAGKTADQQGSVEELEERYKLDAAA